RDAPACIRSPIILLYFIPLFFFCILIRPPHRPTLFPYTTLFRSPTRGLRSWVLEPAFVRPTCTDVPGRCVSAHGDERQSSGKQPELGRNNSVDVPGNRARTAPHGPCRQELTQRCVPRHGPGPSTAVPGRDTAAGDGGRSLANPYGEPPCPADDSARRGGP